MEAGAKSAGYRAQKKSSMHATSCFLHIYITYILYILMYYYIIRRPPGATRLVETSVATCRLARNHPTTRAGSQDDANSQANSLNLRMT